jgi:hypothetical protein
MKTFLNLVFGIIKIFVFCKVGYLLYMNVIDPLNYPLEKLTWWIYFLIFDFWAHYMFNRDEE